MLWGLLGDRPARFIQLPPGKFSAAEVYLIRETFFEGLTAWPEQTGYAAQWVAYLVIDHMETHDGNWPRGWDDLRDSHEHVAQKVSHPRPADWTFHELPSRVDVDWTADPQTLAKTQAMPGQPPFRVIWLRDGRQDRWNGQEPNQMILDYLKQRDAAK